MPCDVKLGTQWQLFFARCEELWERGPARLLRRGEAKGENVRSESRSGEGHPSFPLSCPSACSCDRPYRTSTSSSIAPELIQDKVYRSYAEGKEKEKLLEIATLCLLSIHFLPCTHSLGFTPAPAEKWPRNDGWRERNWKGWLVMGNLYALAFVFLIKSSKHLWQNLESTLLAVMLQVKGQEALAKKG